MGITLSLGLLHGCSDGHVLRVLCLEFGRTPQLVFYLFPFLSYWFFPHSTVPVYRELPRVTSHSLAIVMGMRLASWGRVCSWIFQIWRTEDGDFSGGRLWGEPGAVCGHIYIQIEEAGLKEEKMKALNREAEVGEEKGKSPSWSFSSFGFIGTWGPIATPGFSRPFASASSNWVSVAESQIFLIKNSI